MKRSEPIGTFRARVARDAAALERDGEQYFAMNCLEDLHRRPDASEVGSEVRRPVL